MDELRKCDDDSSKRLGENESRLKRIAIGVSILILFGVFIDAIGGFQILRSSKTIFHGIISIIILNVLYLFVEGIEDWINDKDDVKHPLYKRVYHLILLLFSAAVICGLYIFLFRFLNSLGFFVE